ncbi:uncharacterized protein LOC115623608 [Scaptodrosophila lebanonensis]|uniref:Uncharacterized protein LOC115623608 n=1 Tax=Drosophila lebanonensis TaxID=7225 RepID=A0A6J2TEP4_DROLE|nr:uncharacterized protein LOC115623608 [Scaptodrosophila lebanonensis]
MPFLDAKRKRREAFVRDQRKCLSRIPNNIMQEILRMRALEGSGDEIDVEMPIRIMRWLQRWWNNMEDQRRRPEQERFYRKKSWTLMRAADPGSMPIKMNGHFRALHGYNNVNKKKICNILRIIDHNVEARTFWEQKVKTRALSVYFFVPDDKKQRIQAQNWHKKLLYNRSVGIATAVCRERYSLYLMPMEPGKWYSHALRCVNTSGPRRFRVLKKCLALVMFLKTLTHVQ